VWRLQRVGESKVDGLLPGVGPDRHRTRDGFGEAVPGDCGESFGGGIEGAVDRYVAMTRATQQLVILTSGDRSGDLPLGDAHSG